MKSKQLQEIVAQSMYTGGLLAAQDYGGEIDSKDYELFANSLMKLQELVDKFTTENKLTDIDIDEVFPLHKEIITLLNI